MRSALVLALVFPVALSAIACSKSAPPAAPVDAGADAWPPTPAAWNEPVTRPDDATAAANRAACVYQRGDMPAATLGPSTPIDVQIPIETIVVLMQENRSFDSYYGHLNAYGNRTDIESASPDASNPTLPAFVSGAGDGGADAGAPDAGSEGGADAGAEAAAATTHPWEHGEHLCFLDANHEWAGTHQEWDTGLMDGFYYVNEHCGSDCGSGTPQAPPDITDGERSLWWYDERDLPFYYQLANTFGIGDHEFSALLGPTWPNRMFLYGATSFGLTYNIIPDISQDPFPEVDITVFDELEQRHVTWNIFTDSAPGVGVIVGLTVDDRWGRNPVLRVADFFAKAQAGTLPQVVFVEGDFLGEGPDGNDEHPPADVQVGQQYASSIVHALFASPHWSHLVFFLTYDEAGGEYDHYPPPSACLPDSTPPMLEPGDTTKGTFNQEGLRVPLLVVSPYSKPGFVSHVVHDHTAITRFIETKFKIPALSARDANADPLMEYFDFQNPPFLTPPNIPEPSIDPNELSYCTQSFPAPQL